MSECHRGCPGRDLPRRIHTDDPQGMGLERLEQRTVIAADLDDQRVLLEAKVATTVSAYFRKCSTRPSETEVR